MVDAAGSIPQKIGRYEVVREVGRGTMGVVYEARDPTLARTVAIKTIDAAVASASGAVEDFERRFFEEAGIAARLSHPGIVVCHEEIGRAHV
jgi:eukaryotic-like serine/threonine-protein kinase